MRDQISYRGVAPWLAPLLTAGFITAAQPAAAQSLLPLKQGYAVVTCSPGASASDGTVADPNGFVVGIIDVRDKAALTNPRKGGNWQPPMYHGELSGGWTASRMGMVFGIAIDKRGNIFVGATSVYERTAGQPKDVFGPAGSGGIYKIDGFTGQVTDFINTNNSGAYNNSPATRNLMPNTGGAGLGNLTYDPIRDQLFVTNFEDGKIYRVGNLHQNTGSILGAPFDPFTADNGAQGYAPLGERLWGIGYHNNRVYFATWAEDFGRPGSAQNRIYSLAISGGTLSGSPQLEITPSNLTGKAYSNPVADIEFSSDGRMLLAERTMRSDTVAWAHESRVLMYTYNHPNWTAPVIPEIGEDSGRPDPHASSSGGVDFAYVDIDAKFKDLGLLIGCEKFFWATGDFLRHVTGGTIYGMQGSEFGNDAPGMADNYFTDFNGTLTLNDKTEIGDVDIVRDPCGEDGCIKFTDVVIECKDKIKGEYEVTIKYINDNPFDQDAAYVVYVGPDGVQKTLQLNPTLSDGSAGTITLPVSGLPGETKHFVLQLHGKDFPEGWCCPPQDIRFVLPECRCFDAKLISAGPRGYRLQITNFNIAPDATYLLLDVKSPAGTSVSPSAITLTPPPAPGGTWLSPVLTFTPAPPAGSYVNVLATLHGNKLANGVYENCCIEEFALRVPRRFIEVDWNVTGFVYSDLDLDREFNNRDQPLANQPVELMLQSGRVLRAVTDAAGEYSFAGLEPNQLVEVRLGPLPAGPATGVRSVFPAQGFRVRLERGRPLALHFAVQSRTAVAAPNPGLTLSSTTIEPYTYPAKVAGYSLPVRGYAALTVVDESGNERLRIFEGDHDAGAYLVNLDPAALSPGRYAFRLSYGGTEFTREFEVRQ
ncbi:MAG: hypothetical protein SFV51_04090 [Bryobacteraceae bacterium]|nr:hypothetical protein [Bryobacteraceae bacterium]